MKTVQGNLIQMAKAGEFSLIVHGCNCFNNWGKGLAFDMKKAFPGAYAADLRTIKGDKNKLGHFSFDPGMSENQNLVVVNGYTQFDFWTPGVRANYDAIRQVMAGIKDVFPGRKIGVPKIGAGLARGDWNKIVGILEEELQGEDWTYVEYKG